MKRESCWKHYTEENVAELNELCEEYRVFISKNKTEREFTRAAIEQAEKQGYVSLKQAKAEDVVPGAKFWAATHGKAVMLMQIGRKPLTEGFNILGAHMDSPRLDIKSNAFYEKSEMAFFDTHYYGGIKHYQWVTHPMALHGVIVKKDGTVIDVCIGEDPSDPVLTVNDLLIHLANKQMQKSGNDVVEAEALDLLVGNRPLVFDEKDESDEAKEAKASPVKAYVLQIMKEKYGVEEADFLSAELCAVPAGEARDLGLDRSMIIGYGQDDSACSWCSMKAQFDLGLTDRCAVSILVDKEEIGSVGASGMGSLFFENTIIYLMTLIGQGSLLEVRTALENSHMISSDVNSAVDPNHMDVFDDTNCSYAGRGLVFNKYTGARGKSGANDADAEYVAKIRAIMDGNNVTCQFAELGRVGAGGGGTIAYIPAKYGMNVIDSGVSVLSMHAPWETVSKADIYEAYKGYKAFLINA